MQVQVAHVHCVKLHMPGSSFTSLEHQRQRFAAQMEAVWRLSQWGSGPDAPQERLPDCWVLPRASHAGGSHSMQGATEEVMPCCLPAACVMLAHSQFQTNALMYSGQEAPVRDLIGRLAAEAGHALLQQVCWHCTSPRCQACYKAIKVCSVTSGAC